jgi:hypothetical protein
MSTTDLMKVGLRRLVTTLLSAISHQMNTKMREFQFWTHKEAVAVLVGELQSATFFPEIWAAKHDDELLDSVVQDLLDNDTFCHKRTVSLTKRNATRITHLSSWHRGGALFISLTTDCWN